MPQAKKIPDAKASVDKEWKKARGDPSMGVEKSLEQKEGHSGCTKRQTESPLCYTDGHMSPQKCGVRAQIAEVRRQSRAPGDTVKGDSGANAVLLNRARLRPKRRPQK